LNEPRAPEESGSDPYLRLVDYSLGACVLLNLTLMVPAAMPHRIIGYLAAGLLLARCLYRVSGQAAWAAPWKRRGVALLLGVLVLLLASGTLLATDAWHERPWLEALHLAFALALPLGLTGLFGYGLLRRRDEPES